MVGDTTMGIILVGITTAIAGGDITAAGITTADGKPGTTTAGTEIIATATTIANAWRDI